MYTRDELVGYARSCAHVLSQRYPLRRAVLTGSVARGTVRPWSDIDIVVEGLPAGEYLQSVVYVEDVVPADLRVDLIPYEKAWPSVREIADSQGIVLYERRP